MSLKIIPEHVDPFRYAEQGISLSGMVKLAEMQRIAAAPDDVATAQLQFRIDEQGLKIVRGRLEAKLTLTCQRCMQPFVYEIMANFALGIVNTLDEANALPEHYEPVLAKDGQLALRDMIEDEIILNLPIIPKHAPDQCKVKFSLSETNLEEQKGSNPFQVLASLKEKDKR